jgi:hypothetical protein
MHGIGTSGVELTHVFPQGLWILVDGEELLLSFQDFPWFRNASIQELSRIERVTADHVRWPGLDVDLCLDSIRHPQNYPLQAQVTPCAAEVDPRPR